MNKHAIFMSFVLFLIINGCGGPGKSDKAITDTSTDTSTSTDEPTTEPVVPPIYTGGTGEDVSYHPYNSETNTFPILLSVYVSDKEGNFVTGLTRNNFEIVSDEDVTLVDFAEINLPDKGLSSVNILVDQSKDMKTSDTNDLHNVLANTFINYLNNGNSANVSSFNGGAELYDATYSSLESLDYNAPNANRAIVIVTNGNNVKTVTHNIDDVLTYANELHYPIYIIGLGDSVKIDVLTPFINGTRGLYTHLNNVDEVKSTVVSMNNYINGGVNIYKLALKFCPICEQVEGEDSYPMKVKGIVKVTLEDSSVVNVPFVVFIEEPLL